MQATLQTMVSVLLSPSDGFLGLRKQPRWLLASAIIAVTSAGCVLLSIPFAKQAAEASLERILSAQEIDRLVSVSEQIQYFVALVAPLVLVGKWLIASSFLHASGLVLNAADTQFRRVFSAVVHAESILVLMTLVNLLLLLLRGPESIHGPVDLQVVAGLDLFMKNKSENISLFTLLNGINPFTLWYVATLSTGVRVMTGLGKFTSGAIVTLLWLAGLGIQFGIATVGAGLQAAMIG